MGATTEDVLDEIDFLARSANRVQLLHKLRRNDQVHRDELKASCDASRTTLQRNLEALQENGWIQNTNRSYTLTTKGETPTDHFMDLIDTLQVVKKLEPFLEWVPKEGFDLNLQLLKDADLLVAEPGDPYAMINRHVELLKSMNHFQALLPVTGLHAHEAGHDRVVNNGAQGELIVQQNVAETFRSNPQYRELTEEMLDTGRLNLYVYEDSFSVAVIIIDGTVQIPVAEGQEPRALLETDSPEVREWAEETINDYKQQSEPFSLESE